ncbi:hypothetical protein [Polaromonas sp. A23]|uniref:hypothetical protein n=1 Tax=Polaromonas sp. A23 TaxID=1944133 RepID=UPI00352B4555
MGIMGAGGGAKEELRKDARRPGFKAGVCNGEGAAAMLAGAGGVLAAGLAAVLAIVLMTFSSGLAEALPFTNGLAGLVEGLTALTAGLTGGFFFAAGAGFAGLTGLAAGRPFATGTGFLAAGAFLAGTGLVLAVTLALAFTAGLATVLGLALTGGTTFLAVVFEAAGLAGLAATLVVVLALPAEAAFTVVFTTALDFFT